MARLKVRLRGKSVSDIPLADDQTYVAGRKDDCAIRLAAEKGISREHFRLVSVNGAWTVESLSRFGEVQLAGEKVSSLTLEHGMVFTVPPYEFEFLMTSADPAPALEAPPSAAAADGEAPLAVSQVVSVAPPPPDENEDSDGKTVVGVSPSIPYIKVTGSDGEAKELIRLEGGDLYLAGRDPSCNIRIDDPRVSRRQFEVRRAGTQYSIIDLGSVNGTLLNGNPISATDPTPLKSGDAISVLENYFYFELHDPNFRSRLELVNLQPVEVMHPMVAAAGVESQYLPAVAPEWGANVPAPYQPPYPVMPMPPPLAPAPAETGKFDFKKNRLRLILGGIAVVAVLYGMFDKPADKPADSLGPMQGDPFSKLSPEQQKLVKDTLQLAKSYYMQGRLEFARGELIKMQELIKSYDSSDELMLHINEAIAVQAQQRKQEELEKARAEQEEKIQRKADECRKLVGPGVTKEAMENCLVEVIPFNPGHPRFAELFGEVDRITAEKNAREARDAAHQAEVDKLRGLYAVARNHERQNKPLTAIASYERVIASALPDPDGLRGSARNKVAELRKQVDQRTATYQSDAKKFAEEGNLKDAILTLRKAREIDPQNPYLLPMILEHKDKLQEQMMGIYQEGILEESFGNVEGDESKAGAKTKWKDIIKKDIPDGVYYKKAYIKLKKYGSPK